MRSRLSARVAPRGREARGILIPACDRDVHAPAASSASRGESFDVGLQRRGERLARLGGPVALHGDPRPPEQQPRRAPTRRRARRAIASSITVCAIVEVAEVHARRSRR